jgi:hypothetical protein
MTITSKGIIVYRGPSELTGDPIVAVLVHRSENRKTGDMASIWILPDLEVAPHVASRAGADESVCGDCPLRHYLGGACYVTLFQGPRAVWDALQRGRYAPWDGKPYTRSPMRFGAYGDPSAVPMAVWRRLMPSRSTGHTGYTRQWMQPRFAALRNILMASVHSPSEALLAQSMGWRTFEAVSPGQSGAGQTKPCPSPVIDCATCLRCNGGEGSGRWITIHGARRNSHPMLNVVS